MYEQFTNDFFQNTDLDYNILNENVYSNMLKQSFKSKRKEIDPPMSDIQKSSFERFLDGTEETVPVAPVFTQQVQSAPSATKSRIFDLSDEMIAIISMIVLLLYVYIIISKKNRQDD